MLGSIGRMPGIVGIRGAELPNSMRRKNAALGVRSREMIQGKSCH
jgi:hypothetical protein